MRKELISRAIGDLPDSYLKEAEQFEEEKKSRSGNRSDSPARSRWIRWGAVAACLVLLIGLGLSAVYVVAEAEEYKEAETFFLEHNLSTEGLTRSEVKAVYRDILTRSFSDEKTAEVLRTSIPGFLIEVAEPTPEELARFWDRNSSGPSAPAIESTGYRYTFDYQSPEDFDECTTVVTCSLDGTQCWKVAISSCFLNGALHTGTGTILWGTDEDRVFGHNESPQSADDYPVTRARLILLDETGTIKNDMFLGNGIKYELIDAVVDNSDGTVTVFSIVDFQDLFILKLRPDGSSVFSNKLSCPHG
ncbi:MAG: hypothetical protein J5938_04520, partial [Clostridia bacterium]|nr:hypothetical protein [Clostridia bacterium]